MNRIEIGILAVILVATLAIVWTGDPPPMYDASSHVATSAIAREIRAGDPFFSRHWEIDPAPVPYWFTTLALDPLLGFLSPESALRVLISLYALALPAAFLALVRTIPGGDPRLALLASLAVFNWVYWLGETNFLFGQPIVIFAVALYRRIDRLVSPAFAGFALAAIAVYSCHIFALSALLGAIGLLGILGLVGRRVPALASARTGPAQIAAIVGTGALFAAAIWFIFFRIEGGTHAGRLLFDLSPHRLGNVFEDPLSSPTRTSPLPALLLFAALAALWGAPRWRELVRRPGEALRSGFDLPLMIVGLAFTALVWLGPVALEEPGRHLEEDISPRFALAAFVFLAASVRLPRQRGTGALFAIAIVVFGGGLLRDAWDLHRSQTAAFAGILDSRDADPRRTTYFRLYAANWLVARKRCYVASMFARPGQQALRHRELPGGEHRPVWRADVSADEWASFDWILVQTAREEPRIEGLAEHGTLEAAAGGFRLYQLRGGVPFGATASAADDRAPTGAPAPSTGE